MTSKFFGLRLCWLLNACVCTGMCDTQGKRVAMEFLHKDSVAGKTLLNLVARGSAIIAELLRLSDHIPSVFEEKGPQNADIKV